MKNNEISHLFFQTTPHMGFDYLLFHTANFYKIKTFIFFRTYYENLIIISEDYRYSKFKPIENKNLFLKVNDDIEKLSPSVWYNLGKKINNESKNKSNFLKGLLFFHLLLIKKIKYLIFNKQINSFHSLDGKINIFFFYLFAFQTHDKNLFFEKKLFSICKECKIFKLKICFLCNAQSTRKNNQS